MPERSDEWITVGRISGLFGVRGWIKVFSYIEPRENIVHYSPWYLHIKGEWRPMEVAAGQRHGKGVVALLKGISDRDAASGLVGADIAIPRDQLPSLEPGEYYWSDLEGLRVVTVGGIELGVVDRLMETGANDVLVVKGDRERLIPYLPGDVVVEIDLEHGILRVDWDPDF